MDTTGPQHVAVQRASSMTATSPGGFPDCAPISLGQCNVFSTKDGIVLQLGGPKT